MFAKGFDLNFASKLTQTTWLPPSLMTVAEITLKQASWHAHLHQSYRHGTNYRVSPGQEVENVGRPLPRDPLQVLLRVQGIHRRLPFPKNYAKSCIWLLKDVLMTCTHASNTSSNS
jgi:hypothetical protein